jgi:hypothetical protein
MAVSAEEPSSSLRLWHESNDSLWLRRFDEPTGNDVVAHGFYRDDGMLGVIQAAYARDVHAVSGTYCVSAGSAYAERSKVIITTNIYSPEKAPVYNDLKQVHLGRLTKDGTERIATRLQSYEMFDSSAFAFDALMELHRQRVRELWTVRTLTLDALRMVHTNLVRGVPNWGVGNEMV